MNMGRICVRSSAIPLLRNIVLGFFLPIPPLTIPISLVMLPKAGKQVRDVFEKLTTQQMKPAMVDTTIVPAPQRRMPNNPNSSIKRRVVEDKKVSIDMTKFHLTNVLREA